MFQLGQTDGVTPGGASPTVLKDLVEDLGNSVQQAKAIGASATGPVAKTVTSMAPAMMEKLETTPEQDVASAVAAGEMSSAEVAAMVESGELGIDSFDSAEEAEALSKAAESVKDQVKNDSLLDKATSAFNKAKESVKNATFPTSMEDVKKSSLSEVLKTQDTAAQSYKNNNCANRPYMECAACQWSKTCIDSDNSLKAMLGSFGFLDDYTKALKRGDSNQASQMIDCPGRQRELMGASGIVGGVTGAAASVTTIMATAVSGNSGLFNKVTNAVKTGDMKVVARDQFSVMAGKVVENGSVVGDMRTAMSNVGINPSTLSQAALPSVLRDSSNQNKSITEMLGNAVDAKKISGFNGMSTGSITEITNATTTVDKNYATAIKQASALGTLFNGSKPASDSHASKINTMLDTAYANRN